MKSLMKNLIAEILIVSLVVVLTHQRRFKYIAQNNFYAKLD